MKRGRSILIAMALALFMAVGGLYAPPIGHPVEVPGLEQILAPPVPHMPGKFIDTGNAVYYQTRLRSWQGLDYAAEYLRWLDTQGVQFTQLGVSGFGSSQPSGWASTHQPPLALALSEVEQKRPFGRIDRTTARK
jgi:hypothetical protein